MGIQPETDLPYHFTPDLINLLVDALVKLNRGKTQLLVWLRSAGVGQSLLRPWEEKLRTNRDMVRKADLARDVIARLNEGGDRYIRQRREVIRRVVETEDFSSCWDEERLEAQGLVARVREVVNVKDSFTRMRMEREWEAKKRIEESERESRKRAEQQRQLDTIRQDLSRLVVQAENPQQRGREFESHLGRLFRHSGIQVSEPFRLANEQVDGAVYFESHLYLVEARWWQQRLEYSDVSDLFVKVSTRPRGTRGLFVSASGYTNGCIETCSNASLPLVVFVTLEDIIRCLEQATPMISMLKRKVELAGLTRHIFVPYAELFE